MSFSDYEDSRHGANPVELYLFRFGELAENYRAYTNALAPITFDSVVYQPIPIDRETQQITGKLESNAQGIVVTLPLDNDVSRLFSYFPPSYVVKLTVFKGNVADPATPSAWLLGENFPVEFMGKVNEGSREGQTRVLSCSPLGNSLKRPGLRRNYQLSCPHVLYGPRCNAVKASAMTNGTITAIEGTTISLSPGWMKPGSTLTDYIGGTVEWAGDYGREYRGILRAFAGSLQIMGPPRFLAVTDTVDIFLGCPHTLESCNSLHSNGPNFGGDSFIPLTNPVGKNVYD